MLSFIGGYISGFVRALFAGGYLARWAQILLGAYFGLGSFADYVGWRDAINSRVGFTLMPDAIPWHLLFALFVGAIIVRLAHNQAMHYWRAPRLRFERPNVTSFWLRDHSSGEPKFYLSYVGVTVRNAPFRTDAGMDVERAWAKVELFDKDSRPAQSWELARWEDNEQPPYEGSPRDHFPDAQNYRTLSATRSPSIISIVSKPLLDDYAYRLRGADLITGWVNPENKIPPGEYFVRLTVEGKGLQKPAAYEFMLKNPGCDRMLEVNDATRPIERYWPRG